MACTHQHDCSEHNCATEWSLFQYVDKPKVWALNEAVQESAKSVFKAWDRRLDFEAEFLESNAEDPEIILFIPFTTDVKIKSICVIGGDNGSSPAEMRAFVNRSDVDFYNASELSPVQEWQVAENPRGEIEYGTKVSRFQGVANLTLHFPGNYGASSTRIHYVGLKGETTPTRRDAVTTFVYETLANPSDHKVPGGERALHFVTD